MGMLRGRVDSKELQTSVRATNITRKGVRYLGHRWREMRKSAWFLQVAGCVWPVLKILLG